MNLSIKKPVALLLLYSGKVRSIRFLGSDIAIMIAVGGTVMAGQSDIEPERNSIHILVVIKHDRKRQFTAFQYTRAQYIGRPELAKELTEKLRRELKKIGVSARK